jgi:hypothetical protein
MTAKLTISFDPEKGKLRVTDGSGMTCWGPVDKRKELVERFNKLRIAQGLPPLPDPELPEKPPASDVPTSSSFGTGPLTGNRAPSPKPPKRRVPAAARTVWEEYEDKHDDYPFRERNDAVQFDRWWVERMTARHAESELPGAGNPWWDIAAGYMRKHYKEQAPYAEGEREKRVIPDCAHDKHTGSGERMGRGVEHFFDEGGKLVNCTLPDPYEKLARQVCIENEKRESKRRFEEDWKRRRRGYD